MTVTQLDNALANTDRNYASPFLAVGLAERAAVLERFDPLESGEWFIRAADDVPPGVWLVNWSTLTLTVRADDYGYRPGPVALTADTDVAVELALIDAGFNAIRHLRETVLAAVDALGLPNRRSYLHPATR